MQKQTEEAYDSYQFHQIYQRMHQFCVVDMGSFYLDILKDRLYTCNASSKARLSAQTAMHHILESLVRSLAPILSFTSEEIWGHMEGEREDSVLYATRYDALDSVPSDDKADADWDALIAIRNEVSKQIESLRTAGEIGSALDANVTLFADSDQAKLLDTLGDELRFVLITSQASFSSIDQATDSAVGTDIAGIKVAVNALSDEKCVRCWHRRPDVGTHSAHPELCGRCITNIDGGGETRLHA